MSPAQKDKLYYRLQQLIILILHLVLLKWMHYSLSELGAEETSVVLAHFFGMSVYGALLIRGCAAWGKYRHRLDLEKENSQNNSSEEVPHAKS